MDNPTDSTLLTASHNSYTYPETLNYPTYTQIDPLPINNIVPDPQAYQSIEATTIDVTLTNNEFIDYQNLGEEQFLSAAIQNNPGIPK